MLRRSPFLFIAFIAFLFTLLTFAYMGHFSRYIADDYCTTSVALSQGLLGSVVQWYNTWAGQYTNWLIKGIIAYLGPGIPGLLPGLILTLWLGAAVWTIRQILLAIQLPPTRWFVWGVGASVVFVIFSGIPSIIQSLYWFGASIPYTLPLALLLFYIGFFVRSWSRTPRNHFPILASIVSFVITLFAGGSSEVFAVIQITVSGLLFIGSFVFIQSDRKRSALYLSGAAVAGSLIALLLIVIAPGTAIRQAEFTQRPDIVQVVVQTLLAAVSYIVLAIGIFSPIPLLIAVIFPAAAILLLVPRDITLHLRRRQAPKLLALSAGAAFILLLASFAPSIYAAGSTPPARVYIFPQVILVCMACFWGVVIGFSLKPNYRGTHFIPGAVVTLLLVGGPLFIAVQTLSAAPQFSIYAAEWDARDKSIRTAAIGGAKQVEVNTLTVDLGSMAALETIGSDPTQWVNQCAANYYAVESLIAHSPLKMGDKSS